MRSNPDIRQSHFSYDPLVGYCQGLPFIVAILLLNVRLNYSHNFFLDTTSLDA